MIFLFIRLSIRNVAYIGLRSIDRYERLVIEKFGITAFGMEDIERYGLNVKLLCFNYTYIQYA